jgi:soluble lytic murein transglycosylase
VLNSYQLARHLKELGAYLPSIVAAADVIVASGVATQNAPAYLARLRYPIHYQDLVVAQAAEYGFDPLLMFALIRQESLYNTQAVSSAGARGLTQVMPATGQAIANEVGDSGFQTGMLFRPYKGIEFGAHYLAEQLRRFDGNAAPALASYNAGPGRALDWYGIAGGEVDLFVTTITISETRTYVQRIYSHYAIYRALYGQ